MRLLAWESGPQGLAAIAYLRLEGGSPFVVVLQIIVPLVQLLYEAAAQEVHIDFNCEKFGFCLNLLQQPVMAGIVVADHP